MRRARRRGELRREEIEHIPRVCQGGCLDSMDLQPPLPGPRTPRGSPRKINYPPSRATRRMPLEGRSSRKSRIRNSRDPMRIGSRALVTEAPHRARLTVLDKNDRLVCALGVNDEVCTMEGFPNSREWQTRQV